MQSSIFACHASDIASAFVSRLISSSRLTHGSVRILFCPTIAPRTAISSSDVSFDSSPGATERQDLSDDGFPRWKRGSRFPLDVLAPFSTSLQVEQESIWNHAFPFLAKRGIRPQPTSTLNLLLTIHISHRCWLSLLRSIHIGSQLGRPPSGNGLHS
ncbi:hypothetical protein MPH_00330 [Macrophomina phaseolina MS6]|uniref:Uncharacterized protein n=1 Tax=Macrophomina phaseolina (strain MS6) TaxID=1126212 RepID=K2T0C7_MACPH|nr:hypothetical protein MPH_00330 [Macrophomina phaseolina MS6]